MGRRPVPPAAAALKNVLVVGAGPAGLEAARAAAERGHWVEVVEAAARIGGQFRLAGMQPRRAQILELPGWYERQFTSLGVTLRLNAFLDAEDLAAHPADTIILATGSLPDPSGRQRWMPQKPKLPGLDAAVWSSKEVLRREARLGDTVIVYDEGGNWRGAGTAWFLADQGKQGILVTPDPMVGRELTRTAADVPMRRALVKLGVTTRAEHSVARWHGNGATWRNLLTGAEETIFASALVMATMNSAFDPFPETLPGKTLHRIGDCAAPRLAASAFHEGRKLARALCRRCPARNADGPRPDNRPWAGVLSSNVVPAPLKGTRCRLLRPSWPGRSSGWNRRGPQGRSQPRAPAGPASGHHKSDAHRRRACRPVGVVRRPA